MVWLYHSPTDASQFDSRHQVSDSWGAQKPWKVLPEVQFAENLASEWKVDWLQYEFQLHNSLQPPAANNSEFRITCRVMLHEVFACKFLHKRVRAANQSWRIAALSSFTMPLQWYRLRSLSYAQPPSPGWSNQFHGPFLLLSKSPSCSKEKMIWDLTSTVSKWWAYLA